MSRFDPAQLAALGVPLTRLVQDSRLVQPGDVFVAYPGESGDGRHHIVEAMRRGAQAVLWEARGFDWPTQWNLPNLGIPHLRQQAGLIADQVYGQPSRKLWTIGVTGTNGKTSCSHWLAQSLTALGRRAAVIGTLGNGFPGQLQPTLHTTPDALTVHALLATQLAQGAQAVAMEVSSHALAQDRVQGVHFDVALLTNLTRDHLDYHGDMESYAAAKRRLFAWQTLRHAVLNLDDPYGMALAEALRDAPCEVIGYGMEAGALQLAERYGLRMVHAKHLEMDAQGYRAEIYSSWGQGRLQSSLLGRFNLANQLGVLAVLLASGCAFEAALGELGRQQPVAGRMHRVSGALGPAVVVDYAHTPDALEKVLLTLREATVPRGGRLICVFGCGGDRDRGKRPMMGRVADRFADLCIVTSDNPRSEDPAAIIAAITQGMERDHEVIPDRAAAIEWAIGQAAENDTVLIAGKGHENYQEIANERLPFSDVEQAQQALQRRRARLEVAA